MNKINSEVYVDISIIFAMMSNEMKSKIDSNFIKFIETSKSSTYVSNINPNIPLSKQIIRKETKEMLGIIYRDYLCNQEEKIELLRCEQEEIDKIKKERYNSDNIFNKSNKFLNKEKDIIKDNVSMIEYKESILKKVWNQIKFFLKLNK